MRDRRLTVLVVVGVVALLAGAGLAWAIWDRGPEPAPSAASGPTTPTSKASETVDGRRFVSRAGGFSVRVPAGMKPTRDGDGARFTDRRRGLVVTVGPTSGGALRDASRALLRRVRGGYEQVSVTSTRRDRVDGRPALSTYGRARNAAGTDLRFVVVVVRAKPRNYGIASFTAAGSDPAQVLPRVTTVTRSFRVL